MRAFVTDGAPVVTNREARVPAAAKVQKGICRVKHDTAQPVKLCQKLSQCVMLYEGTTSQPALVAISTGSLRVLVLSHASYQWQFDFSLIRTLDCCKRLINSDNSLSLAVHAIPVAPVSIAPLASWASGGFCICPV